MITTREFSEATGTPYPTVMRWAQNGLIPGAAREETLRGPVWLIPGDAVDTLDKWKPKIGRPQKTRPAKRGRKE